jgi:phospholipase C
MRHWSLDQLADDARTGKLPQVSWILPPQLWSEHPLPSSPAQGAEFTARVLDALTANPEVWSRTVFFLTFDENDGQFDHVPPPAPPSYNLDGSLAGKSTLNLAGHYFHDVERKHLSKDDTLSGNVRPWGLGPRVPAYVISPWSKGGWVCSETFDHTSVGQFLERRFGITIPAISPWHRAISGDLTSAFDFAKAKDAAIAQLPDARGSSTALLEAIQLPPLMVPSSSPMPVQEHGTRPSRALPYVLSVDARLDAKRHLSLVLHNDGAKGAVFHVYDRLHPDSLPRRYTVEAGKALDDVWESKEGAWDLQVFGPGGFFRAFKGSPSSDGSGFVDLSLLYHPGNQAIELVAQYAGHDSAKLDIHAGIYSGDGPWLLNVPQHGRARQRWSLVQSGGWYDLTVSARNFEWRFAGRLETGGHSISDPAIGQKTLATEL